MVNKLHLIYCLVISGVILSAVVICWIISANSEVSAAALQNFSFAATISSIVLAVVSITYSIYSGAGMSGSIGVMQSAEEEIRKQVAALQNIDSRIIDAVKDGNRPLAEQVASVAEQIQPLQKAGLQASAPSKDSSDLFDTENTSLFGMYIIYMCLKWEETGKSWPLDILGNENSLYLYGYLIAMSSVPSLKFSLSLDSSANMVQECSFSEGGYSISVEQLKEQMQKKADGADFHQTYLKTIDDYFAKE